MNEITNPSLFEMGYNRDLVKESLFGPPAQLNTTFQNKVSPLLISGGQLTENVGFGEIDFNGSIRAGDISWNPTDGSITGGSGVILFRKGIIGATAGAVTFSLDATTGDAVFSGNIIGSIITGSVIQTAGSGQRVVIDSGSNTLEFYDADDQVIGIGTELSKAISLALTETTNNGIIVTSTRAGWGFYYENSGNVLSKGLYVALTGATNTGLGLEVHHDGSDGNGIYIDVSAGARGVQISNTGAGASLYITTSGASSGSSIFISHEGNSTKGIELLYSGQSFGCYLEGSDINTAEPVLYVTGNAADQTPAGVIALFNRSGPGYTVGITADINSASRIIGLTFNLVNTGAGPEYAMSFDGSEVVSSSVGGSQDKKVRILIAGNTYYIPCYDA